MLITLVTPLPGPPGSRRYLATEVSLKRVQALIEHARDGRRGIACVVDERSRAAGGASRPGRECWRRTTCRGSRSWPRSCPTSTAPRAGTRSPSSPTSPTADAIYSGPTRRCRACAGGWWCPSRARTPTAWRAPPGRTPAAGRRWRWRCRWWWRSCSRRHHPAGGAAGARHARPRRRRLRHQRARRGPARDRGPGAHLQRSVAEAQSVRRRQPQAPARRRARLPRGAARAGQRHRSQGSVHRQALAAHRRVRRGHRARAQAVGRGAQGNRGRRPVARHRQDRHRRADPAQARAARRRRDAHHARPPRRSATASSPTSSC